MPLTIRWNGVDLPPELRDLAPGTYEVCYVGPVEAAGRSNEPPVEPAPAPTPIAVTGEIPEDIREEMEHLDRMPDGPVKAMLAAKFQHRLSGGFDYFDWFGTPVKVSASGNVSYVFRGGAWHTGGPSYTVRLEECDELSEDEFRMRHPEAASAPGPTDD